MLFVQPLSLLAWAAALAAAGEADTHPDVAMFLMPRAATNLQFFDSTVGGVAADAITQSTDVTQQYEVNGDTFADYTSAVGRSCDNQHNSCADAANGKTANVTVADCDTQNADCKAAAASATQTAFIMLETSTADFDIYCDV